MKSLYKNILDFSEARVSDDLHGYPRTDMVNLNSTIADFALSFIVNDSLNDGIQLQNRHNEKFVDYALIECEAIRKTKIHHDALFNPDRSKGRFFMNNSFENCKNSCSLFYFIFNNQQFSTIDKVKSLGCVSKLSNRRSTFDHRLSPFTHYSPAVCKLDKIDLTLDSFKGTALLETKQTEYTDLTHHFVPLILLEDKINEIEDGLFDKLEKSIDLLLKTESYEEFYKEALLYLAHIEPHLAKLKIIKPDEHVEQEWDMLGDPIIPRVRSNLPETLLTKYKLDCHCGSDATNWKVRSIPVIVEYAFQMEAK